VEAHVGLQLAKRREYGHHAHAPLFKLTPALKDQRAKYECKLLKGRIRSEVKYSVNELISYIAIDLLLAAPAHAHAANARRREQRPPAFNGCFNCGSKEHNSHDCLAKCGECDVRYCPGVCGCQQCVITPRVFPASILSNARRWPTHRLVAARQA
jgi:hypothetical protein